MFDIYTDFILLDYVICSSIRRQSADDGPGFAEKETACNCLFQPAACDGFAVLQQFKTLYRS